MRKFLTLVLGLFVSACIQQQQQPSELTTYVPTGEQPVMESSDFISSNTVHQNANTIQTTKEQNQVSMKKTIDIKEKSPFNPKKTYMAKLAKDLNKIVANSGFIVKQQGAKIVVMMPNDILFGANQKTLEEQIEPILAEIARTLKEYDHVKIQIVGHTDNEGTVAANQAYSLRQANEVSNFLRLNDVDINRITVDGWGPYNPIVNNDTAANRRKNRRVEMTLINVQ